MELSQECLLEELIMAPKIENPFANEFIQNTWNLTPFDQTPDFLELISPEGQFTNLYDNTLEPFLGALSTSPDTFTSLYQKDDFSPEILSSLYEKDDLSLVALFQQDTGDDNDFIFLRNCVSNGLECERVCANAERFGSINVPSSVEVEVDVCRHNKGKPKKPLGQPSKNLMAERRRRKRLNDRLSMLRSIVPKISKMDRTSILGDTIDYVKELLDKIQRIREEDAKEDDINLITHHCLNKELKERPDDSQLRNPPKFEVERREEGTKVEVCCGAKPGLILSTLTTLDSLGLDIHQCVISCFADFSLQASCFEAAEHRNLASLEDVKQALLRSAGYGEDACRVRFFCV